MTFLCEGWCARWTGEDRRLPAAELPRPEIPPKQVCGQAGHSVTAPLLSRSRKKNLVPDRCETAPEVNAVESAIPSSHRASIRYPRPIGQKPRHDPKTRPAEIH